MKRFEMSYSTAHNVMIQLDMMGSPSAKFLAAALDSARSTLRVHTENTPITVRNAMTVVVVTPNIRASAALQAAIDKVFAAGG